MNERNMRASDLIFYNIPESTSNDVVERISHGKEEINKIIIIRELAHYRLLIGR